MLGFAVLAMLAQAEPERVDRELAAKVMSETPPVELIGLGRDAVKALGPYQQYKMVKQERVKGELLPAQNVEMFVQESPFAVRLHFVGGPATGRKVLYNSKENADKFRVREPGFLSIFGAVSVGVDSSLAKSDSNHSVREAGMGSLLDRFQADLKKAEGLGGMKITQEGWDKSGYWCTVYTAPNGGRDFDNAKSRICTDVDTRLPARIEGFDAKGALAERYEFTDVKPAKPPAKFFETAEF